MDYVKSRDMVPTISKLLSKSRQLDVAVAYSTGKLPSGLLKAIAKFLKKGGRFNFLVGVQRNTQSYPLQQLFKLRGSGLDLRCTNDAVFHPKLYLFHPSWGNKETAIVGSSNFSASGFGRNIEVNVVVKEHSTLQQLDSEFRTMFDGSDVGRIDQELIDDLKNRERKTGNRKSTGQLMELRRPGERQYYFANMTHEQAGSYLRAGKYYSREAGFVFCRPENVREGDVVILRTTMKERRGMQTGVVGISTVKGLVRVRARQEKDVRNPSRYRPQGTYVLLYNPIRKPIPHSDRPFNRRKISNRFGQPAQALQGSLVAARVKVANRYIQEYEKAAPSAVRI